MLRGRSITQLIADGQFAALGLVLLAELARTRTAVGAPDLSINDAFSKGQVVVDHRAVKPEKVLVEDVGEEFARPLDKNSLERPPADTATIKRLRGRSVHTPETRDPETSDGRGSPRPLLDLCLGASTLTEPAKTKKKRKNLNSIDDLFQGLS